MKWTFFLVIFCTTDTLFLTPSAQNEVTCGYESCPKIKEGFINIHLIAHSHDDVGWLKTVDQYYYGDNSTIQMAGVQYILDSVIEQLQKSHDRRFIYVETAFFWRWWTNQDTETQKIVHNLVNSGRLEFIGGGWSMNDEATAHYHAIIDQMTLGLRFLNDTFGQCSVPRVAWQIDPFGHSREQASLFAQMGFDGLFFGRLDYQDKENRLIHKNMQTIWNSSPSNLGRDAWLFTGALFNSYDPPGGFCFDVICGDSPLNDDPKLMDYNLDQKIDDFINVSNKWASGYKSNNVLMTMGSDFQYMAAHTWYKNLDKLIKHVNARQKTGSKINLLYSTPSCYLKEVHQEKLTWDTKSDDFFPYASDPHAFWTGYFTSRPNLKYYVQTGSSFLQMCKQMTAFRPELLEKIWALEEAMGIAQHHDAVAGTAKQHVTNDYSARIAKGMNECGSMLEKVYFGDFIDENKGQFAFCHLMNISSCQISETLTDFKVYVYNSLSRDLNQGNLRVPVQTPIWRVTGPEGDIKIQALPIPQSVLKIPGRMSKAKYEVTFPLGKFPGLSLKEFRFTSGDNLIDFEYKSPEPWRKQRADDGHIDSPDFQIKNKQGLSCIFDGVTGLIKYVARGDEKIRLSQNFGYYQGHKGNNTKFEFRASGAYIFRPEGQLPVKITEKVHYEVHTGDNVVEVHQTFSPWISQVIRLYENTDYIEFEWLVGPIPYKDKIGKEIVTKYSTNLKTNGVFYTDANGREILKRKRNSRDTWKYKVYEPVSGNYYPVNTRMILTSDGEELGEDPLSLVIFNDRTQGGSSMQDGEAELMVHRRLLHDDAFGVGEPLNETAFGVGLVTRGKHRLLLAGGKTGVPLANHRPLAQEFFADFHPGFLSSTDSTNRDIQDPIEIFKTYNNGSTKMTELARFLPDNVHLLTIQALEIPHEYLIRFEHIYESFDHPEMSKPAILPVKHLKDILGFQWLRETSLGGNQWRDSEKRFNWTPANPIDSGSGTQIGRSPVYKDGDQNIQINPMEIRSFIFYK